MKILARTQPLADTPVDSSLHEIERMGFDGVEICLENPDLDIDSLDLVGVAKIRMLTERLALQPVSVSYHADYAFSDLELDRVLRAIERTREFGAEIFICGGATKRTGDADEWRRMLDRTTQLVAAGERHDVVVAKEFEPGFICGSSADMLRLLGEIPSRHFAANLDLGHAFLCDPDPLAAIARLGHKIVHCHIEDMKTGVHRHLPPGQGDMDLRAYLRALAHAGFQGGMALDLYDVDYRQVAPEAVRYLRTLMAPATP